MPFSYFSGWIEEGGGGWPGEEPAEPVPCGTLSGLQRLDGVPGSPGVAAMSHAGLVEVLVSGFCLVFLVVSGSMRTRLVTHTLDVGELEP